MSNKPTHYILDYDVTSQPKSKSVSSLWYLVPSVSAGNFNKINNPRVKHILSIQKLYVMAVKIGTGNDP